MEVDFIELAETRLASHTRQVQHIPSGSEEEDDGDQQEDVLGTLVQQKLATSNLPSGQTSKLLYVMSKDEFGSDQDETDWDSEGRSSFTLSRP